MMSGLFFYRLYLLSDIKFHTTSHKDAAHILPGGAKQPDHLISTPGIT
jgi:hypothetical protein